MAQGNHGDSSRGVNFLCETRSASDGSPGTEWSDFEPNPLLYVESVHQPKV